MCCKNVKENLKWERHWKKVLKYQIFSSWVSVYVRSFWAEPGHVASDQVQSWILFFHLLHPTSCAEWQSRNPPTGPLFLESSQEVRHPDEGITSPLDPDLRCKILLSRVEPCQDCLPTRLQMWKNIVPVSFLSQREMRHQLYCFSELENDKQHREPNSDESWTQNQRFSDPKMKCCKNRV